jgi:hypothetical protein
MPKIKAPRAFNAKRWAAGAALWMVLSGVAQAHSFNVAIVSGEAGGSDQLQSAVRGFLVASAERDAHSNETADGHIGGLDVFLTPLPAALASDIAGLVGQASDTLDVVVVLGDDATTEGIRGIVAATVVVTPGTLPDPAQRTGFVEKYVARFETQPTDAAAQGYNAARRIDLAVRQLGGTSQTNNLRDALADTADGTAW